MLRRLGRSLSAWGPVLVWMLLIFSLSAVPDQDDRPGLPRASNERLDNIVREVAHVAEYAVLTGLIWRATEGRGRVGQAALAAGGSLIYAAFDELHQYFVPGRTCSVIDWLLDLGGVLLATLLLVALTWRRRRPLHVPPCQCKQQEL